MKHLLHFTDDGRIQPLWRPGTPWKDRRRLAAAFRRFAEGLDPQERRGYFRFDVDDDGNAEIGGRAKPLPYPPVRAGELERPLRVVKWSAPWPGARP